MPTREELASIRAATSYDLTKAVQVPTPTTAMIKHLQAIGDGTKLVKALRPWEQQAVAMARDFKHL